MLTKEDYKRCKLSPKKLAILKLNGYEVRLDDTYPEYNLYLGTRYIACYRINTERWDVRIASDYTVQLANLRALIGKDNAY